MKELLDITGEAQTSERARMAASLDDFRLHLRELLHLGRISFDKHEDFLRAEIVNITNGSPVLANLSLPPGIRIRLERFGVRTTDGLAYLLEIDKWPRFIGAGSVQICRRAYHEFRSCHSGERSDSRI